MPTDRERIAYLTANYGAAITQGYRDAIRRGGNFAGALRRSIDREMKVVARLPRK